MNWYDDHSNLWLVAAVMMDVEPTFDVLYFLGKPWKWRPEYDFLSRQDRKASVQELAALWVTFEENPPEPCPPLPQDPNVNQRNPNA